MKTVTTRYNITSVNNMMTQIQAWIEQTEETLSNEESRDYPNEERCEALQARIDSLQCAYNALAEIN